MDPQTSISLIDPEKTKLVFDWTMLAFITAGIAQGKGRSGLAWWFISLLFGPLALFFLVVFFDRVTDKPASAPKDEI